MSDRTKRKRTLHINALKEWHNPVEAALLVQEEIEATLLVQEEVEDNDELPTWESNLEQMIPHT